MQEQKRKVYKVVYDTPKGYQLEAGQNGWIPSKEIAEKILAKKQSSSLYRDNKLYLKEMEMASLLNPCRELQGKTVYNRDYLYCDALQIGDYVEDTVVEDFMNMVPPLFYYQSYRQVGEPNSHKMDENGKCRSTYMTFIRVDNDTWEFRGYCFAGKAEESGTELPYVA